MRYSLSICFLFTTTLSHVDLLQIDEDLAWDLQRAEALLRTTIDSHSMNQPVTKPLSFSDFNILKRTPFYISKGSCVIHKILCC